MTAVADFEQRWRQRGKTTDCSFNLNLISCTLIVAPWCLQII